MQDIFSCIHRALLHRAERVIAIMHSLGVSGSLRICAVRSFTHTSVVLSCAVMIDLLVVVDEVSSSSTTAGLFCIESYCDSILVWLG